MNPRRVIAPPKVTYSNVVFPASGGKGKTGGKTEVKAPKKKGG